MTLRHETLPDAHVWWRIADPAWTNPLDPSFAQRQGGRWNPPDSFPTLYPHDARTEPDRQDALESMRYSRAGRAQSERPGLPAMDHRSNKPPRYAVGALGLFATLLVSGYLLAALAPWNHDGPRALPAVSISTIDGRSFDPATLAGRPLLVTFWSTTCVVCLHEIPELEALYRRFSRQGFEVIAVAMPWDSPGAVVQLARARGTPYPVALDTDGAIARAFGDVSVTPTHFLFDPDGGVAFRRTGALDFPALTGRLRSML